LSGKRCAVRDAIRCIGSVGCERLHDGILLIADCSGDLLDAITRGGGDPPAAPERLRTVE